MKNLKDNIQYSKSRLENFKRKLEWRKNRESDPKCLTCGNTSFDIIDYSLGGKQKRILDFTHSGCGSKFVVRESDIRINVATQYYYFD